MLDHPPCLSQSARRTLKAESADGSGKGSNGTKPAKQGQQQQKGGKRNQNPEENKTADEVRELRAAKATALRDAGKNPFAYRFDRTDLAAGLQAAWADLPPGEEAPADTAVAVAGRVMTRRVMGKLAFVTLRDDSGTIQLYVDKSRLAGQAEAFQELKGLIDAGDFVGVRGGLRRTDKGELSVVADTIEVRA
jgi:lysyl-tRNA synthetase, class II